MPAPHASTSENHHRHRSAAVILGTILAILALIIYIWWPLVQEYARYFNPAVPLWRQIDWLLIGIFLFMSILIARGADLRRDGLLAAVGFVGGALIETWGTHTGLWAYYTGERPPLWILPAWPIAALAIERMARIASKFPLPLPKTKWLYGVIFTAFIIYQVVFTASTLNQPASILALAGVVMVTLTSRDEKLDLLTFICGAALGYFLETWGTTRECWAYYTGQRPPLFAVLAHGIASVAFWRMASLARSLVQITSRKLLLDRQHNDPADS
jgi:uncharacterized membrane protein YoaT (DUF817 family)